MLNNRSKYERWEQQLAPRIILGLWHPLFIRPAYQYLPSCTRYHIGISPSIARQYFWNACAGFSINFSMLVGGEGQKFIADCRAAGKEVCVWTVNDPNEMRTSMTWGVQAILTDKVGLLSDLKQQVRVRMQAMLTALGHREPRQPQYPRPRCVLVPLESLALLCLHTRMRTLSSLCVSALTRILCY